MGSRKYDPVHLGYMNEKDPQRGFEFDTTKSGNRNSGHEYGTKLSERKNAVVGVSEVLQTDATAEGMIASGDVLGKLSSVPRAVR